MTNNKRHNMDHYNNKHIAKAYIIKSVCECGYKPIIWANVPDDVKATMTKLKEFKICTSNGNWGCKIVEEVRDFLKHCSNCSNCFATLIDLKFDNNIEFKLGVFNLEDDKLEPQYIFAKEDWDNLIESNPDAETTKCASYETAIDIINRWNATK